ncbi:MAG: rhodanese-like domain-containing protein [Micavibrio sp.]
MQDVNGVPHITPQEAREWQKSGRAVLVDVREPVELAAVAIEGAVNVPGSCFNCEDVLAAAGDKEIVFFCKMGGRAMQAHQYFTSSTGRQAVCMDGSITGWAAAGLPVTEESAA